LQKIEDDLRPHQNEHFASLICCIGNCYPLRSSPSILTERPLGSRAADLAIRPEMTKKEALHTYDLDPRHPLVNLALAGFEDAASLSP
jgi:hypothetical protein